MTPWLRSPGQGTTGSLFCARAAWALRVGSKYSPVPVFRERAVWWGGEELG